MCIRDRDRVYQFRIKIVPADRFKHISRYIIGKPVSYTHLDVYKRQLARLQREAAENQNSISRQTKNRGAR